MESTFQKIFSIIVPTQVVTIDNLGLTQVITMVPANPSGTFLPQIRCKVCTISFERLEASPWTFTVPVQL